MKQYPQATKFRVIIGEVSLYTTAKQIRRGIGDFEHCNAAVQKALNSLEFENSVDSLRSVGMINLRDPDRQTAIEGVWSGIRVNLCEAVY